MIRSFYGLTQNPFDAREIDLLPQQREIHDTLKVHCQQGGLCLVLGAPGTGKSVIKQALQRLPEKQHLVATVARTLHTYTNTVRILCDAFRVEFESSAFKCERRLIEQAFSLNHAGKSLTTVLDDLLMDMANLRQLRLLFEDFPKNHNLVLIGRPSLLATLDLGVNHDIKSRVTYSVIARRLSPDAMREFIRRELDRSCRVAVSSGSGAEMIPVLVPDGAGQPIWFNNKIRVIQRRAYGIRDEEYLRLKILASMLPKI